MSGATHHITKIITIIVVFVACLAYASPTFAATTITSDITSDTHWALSGSPYIIQLSDFQHFTIPAGATLIIDPGVVVKFDSFNGMWVQGTLRVLGTESSPVYFTSFKDDVAAGDTNDDGLVTIPNDQDWMHIQFDPGSVGDISHAVIRYGGQNAPFFFNTGIENDGGTITLDHVEFSHNGYDGLGQYAGSTTMTSSDIHDHQVGISMGGGTLTLSNTRIHDNNIGIDNQSDSTVNATNNWWGSGSGPYDSIGNPTGMGNGIIGPVAYTPWSTSDPAAVSSKPSVPVIIIPGILGSMPFGNEWVMDPILHTYDNLTNTFLANGYVLDTTLFVFPYDWRNSNIDTAVLLKQKIDSVKATCACDHVDIIAHSMGGLVARQYIQSAGYGNDVRKIIFLGTPHAGAPQDYLMWEGEALPPTNTLLHPIATIGNEISRMLLKQYAVEKGYRTIFDLLHNAPIESIQQLLPDYNYLTNGTSLSGVHPPYPTNYPRNTLLEDLAASQSTLTSRADITNMVGDTHNNDTIAGLRIASSTTPRLWPDGMPEGFNNLLGDHGLNLGAGDGTVPLSSATSVGGSSITFNSDHQHLVTDAATTTYKILTGREVAASTSFRALLTHFLMVRVFSPVDMQVVAPDGMRIGKDFVTGTTLNEIPDAFYTGFQGVEGEFVVIPEPASGQYKVITQGTGTGGSYTVATDYLADATTSEQTFTGTTPANLLIEHTMNLDTIHPTNDTLVPVDTTPPSITKDQPATSTYTHADQLPIHVTFTDNTGVATSSVVFDGQSVNASSTVDLFYTTLGIHALVLSAQDFVHNATTSTTTITIIATIPSTISDVNRAYSLGWITNLAYKRSLLTTLALAGNISAQMGELEQRPLPSKVIKEGAVFNKILLKIILLALQLGKSQKYLTAQGYTVLVNDINWLLAH